MAMHTATRCRAPDPTRASWRTPCGWKSLPAPSEILAVLFCLSLHPLYLRTLCEPRQRTVGQAQVATDKRVAGHTQVGGLSGGVPVTHLPTAAAVSSAGKNAQRSWAPYAVPGGRPPTRAPRPLERCAPLHAHESCRARAPGVSRRASQEALVTGRAPFRADKRGRRWSGGGRT